jgi:ubiquinone/menaquinone biosynthesis C-methylase UbiE
MSVDPTPWVNEAEDFSPPAVIFDLFRDLPRQGPGTDEDTLKAWSMLDGLPEIPRILNIGCGTGADVLAIAREVDVRTTAIDIDQPSLDVLAESASKEGLSERVTPLNLSMFELKTLKDQVFDVIWAEGSVFLYGFDQALRDWKRYLEPRGYLVISDLVWFTDTPPAEAEAFWKRGYPGMKSYQQRKWDIINLGFSLIDSFQLPESGWLDPFYVPMEKRIPLMREKYKNDPESLKELDEAQAEADLFKKHSDSYGYSFYVMQLA